MKHTTTINGSVEYTYNLRHKGWNFNFVNNGAPHTVISHIKGKEKAEKVSNIINASLNRVGHLDNMARANISVVEGIR